MTTVSAFTLQRDIGARQSLGFGNLVWDQVASLS